MSHATKPKPSDQQTRLSIPPFFNPFIYPYTVPTSLPSFYQQPLSQPISILNISLNEFFAELDRVHNCNGIYAALENSFKQQDITVNVIKDLTDNELIELGVSKIGWRKNIKQAAQKY